MKKEVAFKSHYSFFFYLFSGFFLIVFSFALYRFATGDLDLPGFLFLTLLSFLIGYFFSFRFDCQITLNSENLTVRYILPFRKKLSIKTDSIIEFDKHEDTLKRYHKKMFIKTLAKSYLIRYNISDSSDENLLKVLHRIIIK